ncbi:MAG: hypothetical protein Q3966_02905 [Neisseria sp.]|nr:hypothetical protein [Neisseria sp.]
MQLTLALPGLNRPSDSSLPATPALNELLRFGRFVPQPCSVSAFYARYLWRGSLTAQALAAAGLPDYTPSVLASPLHQRMGINQTHFAAGRGLAVSMGEARQWCGELNDFFRADGWRFYPFRPELWLLTLPEQPAWRVPPVLDILGQADGMERMEGDADASWLARQTEIQMWLHGHALNAARAIPVNGLWLWPDLPGGAGADLTATDSEWALNPATGLIAAPADWAAFEKAAADFGRTVGEGLIFLDDLAAEDDAGAYRRLLAGWEGRFFAPILRVLQAGRLEKLIIATDGARGGCLEIKAKPGRAFWRRRKTFAGFLG